MKAASKNWHSTQSSDLAGGLDAPCTPGCSLPHSCTCHCNQVSTLSKQPGWVASSMLTGQASSLVSRRLEQRSPAAVLVGAHGAACACCCCCCCAGNLRRPSSTSASMIYRAGRRVCGPTAQRPASRSNPRVTCAMGSCQDPLSQAPCQAAGHVQRSGRPEPPPPGPPTPPPSRAPPQKNKKIKPKTPP